MNIIFSTDGSATCLYTDSLPLRDLGTITVERASNVEFNAATQKWEVRAASAIGSVPLFTHSSRAECLTWEHVHDRELLELTQ